jgi:hypothetical protein
MNKRAYSVSKYLFLYHLINHEPGKALDMSHYIKELTMNATMARKFELAAKLAIRFSFIISLIKRRLLKRTFPKGKRQSQYQHQYSWCIEYARRFDAENSR